MNVGKLRPLLKGDEVQHVADGVYAEMTQAANQKDIDPKKYEPEFNTLLSARMVEREMKVILFFWLLSFDVYQNYRPSQRTSGN